jgi:hypothetical protein
MDGRDRPQETKRQLAEQFAEDGSQRFVGRLNQTLSCLGFQST